MCDPAALQAPMSLTLPATRPHAQVAQADGEVIITNDGATILNKMSVTQPAAKMLVQLAASQDAAAGDGLSR